MQIASMHIKNVLYGRSNETNEGGGCMPMHAKMVNTYIGSSFMGTYFEFS